MTGFDDLPTMPRPASAAELSELLTAERAGAPLLLYRDGNGDGALTIVSLAEAPPRLAIGRGARNDVALPWDEEVSRTHAELVRIGDDWTVFDEGLAHNGTFVNGERVGGRRRLEHGDAIRVGRTLIVFHAPEANADGRTRTAVHPIAPPHLSDQQRRVLIALCRPLREQSGAFVTPATNQQIAAEVHLSVDAVKAHLRALFHAFGLTDAPQNVKRVRLAERALRSGVVHERDL
jgi:predicted component of type VI protein secretion system